MGGARGDENQCYNVHVASQHTYTTGGHYSLAAEFDTIANSEDLRTDIGLTWRIKLHKCMLVTVHKLEGWETWLGQARRGSADRGRQVAGWAHLVKVAVVQLEDRRLGRQEQREQYQKGDCHVVLSTRGEGPYSCPYNRRFGGRLNAYGRLFKRQTLPEFGHQERTF